MNRNLDIVHPRATVFLGYLFYLLFVHSPTSAILQSHGCREMCKGGQTGEVGRCGTRGFWPCRSSAVRPTVPGAAAAAAGWRRGGSHPEPGEASVER